jgi:hypothetical protein
MTKERLKRNIDYMKILARAKKRQRDALLTTADKDLILCLCDCANNILNGNVRLNPDQYQKLKKYKLPLRSLIDKRIKVKDKQDIIVNQKGGFLPLLLTPILSIVGSLIADAVTKK